MIENVKIGNIVYKVEVTNNISLGANYTGEICYSDCIIRIRPQNPQKMLSDLFHEIFHGIYDFCGYGEHEEAVIDRFAHALGLIVQDNPELFTYAAETNNTNKKE